MGLFQGLTAEEIRAEHGEAYDAWRRDAVRNRPVGGETLEDLRDLAIQNGEPETKSGKQEWLENIINQYL